MPGGPFGAIQVLSRDPDGPLQVPAPIFPSTVIPNKIHFVWSGKGFPYPFALAVKSAVARHPGWEVVVHVGEEPVGNPHWDSILPIAQVRREDPESILARVPEYGERLLALHRAVPASYPAGRSNLVRLAVLASEGGWYLDFDTLCVDRLDTVATDGAAIGEEWVWRHDQERVAKGFSIKMIPSVVAFAASWIGARSGLLRPDGTIESVLRRIWGRKELNNAVIGAEPGHSWIRRLLELACDQDPSVRFALGPALVNLGWTNPGRSRPPFRAPTEVFYQFPPSQTSRYFRSPARDLPRGAVVLHWCSSNHRDLVRAMDPQLVRRCAGRGPWFREASNLV